MDDNRITYFALTDTRNKKVPFGIKAQDRTKHVYVIGKTGMGKSTLLENMAIQDIQSGSGLAFIDPHGGTAEKILEYIPEERVKDVLYFAPFDIEHPVAFNVMEDVGPDKRHLVLSGLMSAFKKLFGEESFSDRMQYILQNTILALLEYPGATMLGINKMLSDKEYRNKVIANITDPSVKSYWVKEYAGYTERFAADAIPAVQNKIGQFTSNPLIRNIIGQAKSSFDIRKMMDEKKIIIINLSKGKVGENNANLLGSMLITKIYLAAMSRADVPAERLAKLPNFYLYVDEFQSFANESFADILSEARKYKLNLTIAHQYIEQMSEEVRAAVIGNVGTMIAFRVGAIDAELFEKEFAPQFLAEDIVNLGIRQIYLKLMIDGVSSQPFSATTMPPIPAPTLSYRDTVIASSRMTYGRPRAGVEGDIAEQMLSTPAVAPRPKEGSTSTTLPRTTFSSTPGASAPPRAPREKEDLPRPPRIPVEIGKETGRENVQSGKHLDGLRSVLASVVKDEAPPSPAMRVETPRQAADSPVLPTTPSTPPAEIPRPVPTPPPPSRPSAPPSHHPASSYNHSTKPVHDSVRPHTPPSKPFAILPRTEPRGGKTANKELLHAALQEALKKQQIKPSPPVTPAPRPLVKEEKPAEPREEEKKVEKKEEAKPEPRPELRTEHAPSHKARNAPREVPEDELKRLLET